jgi:hydroxymethylpyrimidine/phosphomethylpyrimidine kinase
VEDFQIQAIKIGMIGSINLLDSLSGLLDQLPETPVILDPVLSAGGGASVSSNAFIEKLISSLLPKTTLITPNIPEAQQLSGKKSADDCAASLMQLGCKNILITGTHEDGINVVNRLYSESAGKLALPGPRLPQEYHGSGCTLSSAISFYIASGHSLTNALKLAQEFTFNSLQQADRPGRGQFFPIRNRKRWI